MPEKQKEQSQKKNKKTGVILSFLWRCLVALVLAAVVLTNLFTHVVQIVNYHGIGIVPDVVVELDEALLSKNVYKITDEEDNQLAAAAKTFYE